MKKIFMTAALVAFAASAFAAGTVAVPSGITGFAVSKGVAVSYESGLTNTVYSIASKHLSGNKIFGTTSASTSIVFTAGEAGVALATTDNPTPPTTVSDSAITGGKGSWSTM